MILFLIGFMGSGKSHYAKAMASYLQVPCYDLDTEIEQAEHKKINQIFAEDGEPYFRLKESEILKKKVEMIRSESMNQAGDTIQAIIACGGGTPCFEGNMDWMNQHGFTIWIAPPVSVLADRLEKEKQHRPLIKDLDRPAMERFIDQKLIERSFFYQKANLVIVDPTISAENIIKLIKHA